MYIFPLITAMALPPGYNLYMFGRCLRKLMYECKPKGINLDEIPDVVEIIWLRSNEFYVKHENLFQFKCLCSHNRKEFSELLRANNESNEICDKFDNEGKYSVYIGESNIFMSICFNDSDYKLIDVELAKNV